MSYHDGLPPVPPLRAPMDADAYVKLEAVAGRAAHRASEACAMEGWARAEYVENEVRVAMRAYVSGPIRGQP
jgi:hypothetical protein